MRPTSSVSLVLPNSMSSQAKQRDQQHPTERSARSVSVLQELEEYGSSSEEDDLIVKDEAIKYALISDSS